MYAAGDPIDLIRIGKPNIDANDDGGFEAHITV